MDSNVVTNNGAGKKVVYFVGPEVDPARRFCIAVALSGVHGVMMGAPGGGKTDMSRACLKQMFSQPGQYGKLNVEASTPPEKVEGPLNIALALNENRLENVVDGTIMDPNIKGFQLDEGFRASDVVFDALIHPLDEPEEPDPLYKVAICTSNFPPSGDRAIAMIDRFGLWYWMGNIPLDITAVVTAQMQAMTSKLVMPGTFPTWDEIVEARLAEPGPNAIRAVSEVCEKLEKEANASSGNWVINRRRTKQWSRILFRYSYWLTRDNDFTSVPAEAASALIWAHPLLTEKEAREWEQICGAIADPVDTAIKAIQSQVYQEWKRLADENKRVNGTKIDLTAKLGRVLQDASASLDELHSDDPRIPEVKDDLTNRMYIVVQGGDPMKA